MNPIGKSVQAAVQTLAKPRVDRERQSLLARIYNLEYIAIPALQWDYQQHVEERRDQQAMDQAFVESKQAVKLAQESLVELKRELLNLEARPHWNFRQSFNIINHRWRHLKQH